MTAAESRSFEELARLVRLHIFRPATLAVADEIKLPERFRIDQEIRRGGMAVVYRAYDDARLLRMTVMEELM